MKKLISIIAALSMIASLGVTSFAAIDVAVSEKDAAKATLAKQDDGSFTADLAANSNASQDTIVVIKGTNPDDITTTSIEYINQDAASQNFNFVLKNTPDAEEDFAETTDNKLTYTVLMGGDKVEKTTVGTITYTYTADEYTVTYVIDGETYDSTKTVKGIPQLPATTPTKEADAENTYAFDKWYTDAGCTTAFDATVAISADTTVYGKFTATPIPGGDEGGEDTENVTISYQLVKVDVSSTTVDATISTADVAKDAVIYTSVTEPTLSGYGFVGWYTDEALTTKLDKALTATEATTIYAKMAKIYKLGDVDGDRRGAVNMADYVALKAHVSGTSVSNTIGNVIPGTSKKLGDVDGDRRGTVNMADYVALKAHVSGTSVSETIGTTIEIVKD